MKMVSYWQDELPEPTQQRRQELGELAKQPDVDIDYSDIPPLDDAAWQRAVPWREVIRNDLYKPKKIVATVRVDADVMEWLKRQGRGYQTRLNAILREAMLQAHQSHKTPSSMSTPV